MCTSISFQSKDHYFGRTLDYEISFGEKIVITPREYPFHFRKRESILRHHSIIGMAAIADNYPLYFDAINEKGLAMAGLHFPKNAHYFDLASGKENIAPFELIPWILGQSKTVKQAIALLKNTNIVNIPYNSELPLSPLHWMIADQSESIVLESVEGGMKIYSNPVGVLTNNPPFPTQLFNLNNYITLSKNTPKNTFLPNMDLEVYSRGLGGLGLPGDLSSMSRFVRAAFVKANSICGDSEEESVSQFFHILGAVEQQRGCVSVENDQYEITRYTSCCNLDKKIYYYTTYDNSRISAVSLKNDRGDTLISYPLLTNSDILYQN